MGQLLQEKRKLALDRIDIAILEALQKGYLFKEKLIRPAIVKVAAAPDGTE